jgi:toxin FitB
LVDTDVFVDHLRGARKLDPGTRSRVFYSVITRCELLAGAKADDESVSILLAPFAEIPVDRAIAERAGRLRRHVAIRTPDALLAATALEHRLAIVTRNPKHFAPVPGLKLRVPR